jgi:hypothetical protein
MNMTVNVTTARLAALLGMTVEDMKCGGYDLDLFDAARWLIESKINLEKRDEVEAALGSCSNEPAGFVDAAVVVASRSELF